MNSVWPQWRGPDRNGLCDWLTVPPEEGLPLKWEVPLQGEPNAGVAVADGRVLVADRDFLNQFDRFVCLNADSGELIWQMIVPAVGDLDYGNSSRSTPLVHGDSVWFQSAFGNVYCCRAKDGQLVWQSNVISQYGAGRELVWGLCSSPLLSGGKLILNPGGRQSSLVALNAQTGELIWSTPGNDYGYGSFITARMGTRDVVIGHDKTTLGAWDVASGKRLWSITPKESDDFNVPTPLVDRNRVIVATENNGCRAYKMRVPQGSPPELIGHQPLLNPETSTPLLVNGLLYGVSEGTLYCLKVPSLEIAWEKTATAFHSHASLISDGDKIYLIADGELFVFSVSEEGYQELGHQELFRLGTPIYSHPAIYKNQLFAIGKNQLRCFELVEDAEK
ncbi:PQQ-binding-like beta-propeller repeat protein [uncultured Rubinisphaera sp.]|uniref:PQQ-binding-like beta-propeller repeat protein n=1 Tax=uncultured Rubinisphaera sp. TaxID=1678686 RepID=UPI0030D8477E